MPSFMNTFARTACIALGASLLGACASTAPAPEQSAGAADRARQRWALLIARDPAKAWEFLSPGYRSTMPLEQYTRETLARPITWISAEVRDEVCESEACTITVGLEYQATLPTVGKVQYPAFVEERWIRLDDGWYHVPEKVVDIVPPAAR